MQAQTKNSQIKPSQFKHSEQQFEQLEYEEIKADQLKVYKIQNIQTTIKLPDKIFAGQIHYSRIPVQYWEHRIQMIKALGLNALSIYIMWNYHQVEKGVFDYQTENKNLPLFLDLAHKYDMKVLIRPGPYVCAQWDFGGLPVRLMCDPQMKIRSNTKKFLDEVGCYFESLKPILKPRLSTNGGPITLLQIQNEYGLYGTDSTYIQAVKQLWKDLNFDQAFYYADASSCIFVSYWNGANVGINNGVTQAQFDAVKKFVNQTSIVFGGEIYSGWLTHWQEVWQSKSLKQFMSQYSFLLKSNYSFSMYMVHGGTNFGLTAGANSYYQKFDYKGDVTSYDYDAPITEQGRTTQKYMAFRKFVSDYVTWVIPQKIPDPIPTMTIAQFKPEYAFDILQKIPVPSIKDSQQLICFQSQQLMMTNQGFVLYETQISKGNHKFDVIVRDFAIVYLNGIFYTTLNRSQSKEHILRIKASSQKNILRILVQAMGHINYSVQMAVDYKGLIKFSSQKQQQKQRWTIYKYPINSNLLIQPEKNLIEQQTLQKSHYSNSPKVFKYIIKLQKNYDTYFNMSNWEKGYLFVNGRNLGRYWNQGPQQALFCPGVWLKQGDNQIIILDLIKNQSATISGVNTLHQADKKDNHKWPCNTF